MKYLLFLLLLVFVPFSNAESLQITVKKPDANLTMGDRPVFESVLTNKSDRPVENIVLYISLVNLNKGREHPVDLEDWSAQKAVHLARIEGRSSSNEQWSMRLIQSGHYGLFVTAVSDMDIKPLTSDIVFFDIRPKKTVIPSRIWPVAMGVPLLLLLLMILIRIKRYRTTNRC